MTQVLTLAASHNARTQALVEEYMSLSKDQLAGIDQKRYPVSVLLDIAQSNGVTELDSVSGLPFLGILCELSDVAL